MRKPKGNPWLQKYSERHHESVQGSATLNAGTRFHAVASIIKVNFIIRIETQYE